MDIAALLRTLGGLGMVLGLLAGALWIVRRYDIALPGRVGAGGTRTRRVELVEQVRIDQRRSVVLVRRDDREHLFVLHPDRATLLEGGIVRELPAFRPAAPKLCAALDAGWFDE